jgi:hypothetical protein
VTAGRLANGATCPAVASARHGPSGWPPPAASARRKRGHASSMAGEIGAATTTRPWQGGRTTQLGGMDGWADEKGKGGWGGGAKC